MKEDNKIYLTRWQLMPAVVSAPITELFQVGETLNVSVPGCVHTDLLTAGKIPDPFYDDNERRLTWIHNRDWIYQTEFDFPPEFDPRHPIFLVFRGLDTVTEISLNGKKLWQTENMFRVFRFEVHQHLKPGKNNLTVRFLSPVKYGKKS